MVEVGSGADGSNSNERSRSVNTLRRCFWESCFVVGDAGGGSLEIVRVQPEPLSQSVALLRRYSASSDQLLVAGPEADQQRTVSGLRVIADFSGENASSREYSTSFVFIPNVSFRPRQ